LIEDEEMDEELIEEWLGEKVTPLQAFGFSTLSQFLPCPSCCLMELLRGRKTVNVLEIANMSDNAVATA
jgi:hypothetical protein